MIGTTRTVYIGDEFREFEPCLLTLHWTCMLYLGAQILCTLYCLVFIANLTYVERENLNRGLASIRLHVHKSVRGHF